MGQARRILLPCLSEVSERLVGSPAFKAGGTSDPRPAGSIPVHLRQTASLQVERLCVGPDRADHEVGPEIRSEIVVVGNYRAAEVRHLHE